MREVDVALKIRRNKLPTGPVGNKPYVCYFMSSGKTGVKGGKALFG